MTYPHPALATQLPIAAGAENDAWDAIVNNNLIRAMISPDPSQPYTIDNVTELAEKVSLGFVPENTIAPYIVIRVKTRLPEYCINEDPQVPGQKLSSVSDIIEIHCAALRYQEARDLALMVLKTLEPISTPHVRRWKQTDGGFEYGMMLNDDGSPTMEQVITLTLEAFLAME